MKNFTINHELELCFTVELIYYYPERPAPHCQNPSHQDYSDPGDGEDYDYRIKLTLGGIEFEAPDEVYDDKDLSENIVDKIREICNGEDYESPEFFKMKMKYKNV